VHEHKDDGDTDTRRGSEDGQGEGEERPGAEVDAGAGRAQVVGAAQLDAPVHPAEEDVLQQGAVGQHGRHLTELALEFARFRRDTEARLAAHGMAGT
jgi:hypothetical protein